MSIWILFNGLCMFGSLYVAFSKRFRPMSWPLFYFNIAAAALNALVVASSVWRHL